MKPFRVAATQVDVRSADVGHNLDTHRRLIAEAAAGGCALDRLPGTVDQAATMPALRSRAPAEPYDGPIFAAIRDVARAHPDRRVRRLLRALPAGRTTTPRALVGPDGLIGLQRKVHASFDEFYLFRQATSGPSYDVGFCTTRAPRSATTATSSRAGGSSRSRAPRSSCCRMPTGRWRRTTARSCSTARGASRPAEELLRAQERLLEGAARAAAAARRARARQRRLRGLLRPGRLRRPQRAHRRRLRARSGRRPDRALAARHGHPRGSPSSSTRSGSHRVRENPMFALQQAPSRDLRGAGTTAMRPVRGHPSAGPTRRPSRSPYAR